MKEVLEQRIVDLKKVLEETATNHKMIQQSFEQNAARHNMALGAKAEAEDLLAKLFAKEIIGDEEPKKLSGQMG